MCFTFPSPQRPGRCVYVVVRWSVTFAMPTRTFPSRQRSWQLLPLLLCRRQLLLCQRQPRCQQSQLLPSSFRLCQPSTCSSSFFYFRSNMKDVQFNRFISMDICFSFSFTFLLPYALAARLVRVLLVPSRLPSPRLLYFFYY